MIEAEREAGEERREIRIDGSTVSGKSRVYILVRLLRPEKDDEK